MERPSGHRVVESLCGMYGGPRVEDLTPLVCSARLSYTKKVELIEMAETAGYDLDAKDSNPHRSGGSSLLFNIIQASSIDMVQYLIG